MGFVRKSAYWVGQDPGNTGNHDVPGSEAASVRIIGTMTNIPYLNSWYDG